MADDKAKAIALFDEGKKELAAGNHAKACRAFEASARLLPDSGTRGSLARCYALIGRVASAWTLWRELADTAPPELRADAANQARKLEPRLPRYRVKLAAPAPGMVVTLAGDPVDTAVDVAVPIDPGTYALAASAPGREPWTAPFTATEGRTVTVTVPALAERAVAPPPPARGGRAAGDPRHAGPSPPSKPPAPGGGRRALGLVVVVTGVGGLAASGVLGAIARSRNADARSTCGGAIDACDPGRLPEAQARVDDARAAARIATIAAIAGGVAVVAGAALYVTAPRRAPRVGAASRGARPPALTVVPVAGAEARGTYAGVALTGGF